MRRSNNRVIIAASMLAFLAFIPQARAGSDDKRLDIYWIDVEGGAATLIVTPLGESVLIDAGNPGTRDADRIVKTASRVAGLKQIDHLVVTHYHVDHFGGAAMLSTMMPIKHVYDNGIFEGIREKPDQAYLDFKTGGRSVINPGDHLPLKKQDAPDAPELLLKCVAARQKFLAVKGQEAQMPDACERLKSKPVDNSDNANSVVLVLGFGPFRFFDAGDLTWNVEQGLVCPVDLVGKVDVYQVTHHGLDASNYPLLLQTLQPTVAVMNNGATKGCEPGTFAALKDLTSLQAIYQMHRNLRTDGSDNNTADELIANPEQECKANYIKLSVAADAKSYTVSIPGRNHERVFKTK